MEEKDPISGNFKKDPYREGDAPEDDLHFVLPHEPAVELQDEPHKNPTERVKESKDNREEGPRSMKEVLKDASRQIIASVIILIIGFFALNWSAYYQIIKNEYQKAFDSPDQIAELQQERGHTSPELLVTSSNPQVQKHQIPDLDIDIAPSDDRLIIPRINQNIPVVRVSSKSLIEHDWDALEKEMQEALRDGVVHYPGTSVPGQKGNVVITGHSSYFPWDPGRFKDVFALLHDVEVGDEIVMYYQQDKYKYEVNDIEIVLPENIDVLKQTPDDRLTLITCTPVGTNLKRLIVTAKPVVD